MSEDQAERIVRRMEVLMHLIADWDRNGQRERDEARDALKAELKTLVVARTIQVEVIDDER